MLKLFPSRADRADPAGRPLPGLELELPTFSGVTLQALDTARDIDSSLTKLADVLVADPGFTARLMATVNSAAFGSRHQVTNIHHAVSLLGRNEIESMLIAVAVRNALPDRPAEGYEPDRFWTTAATRAATARALAARIDPSRASESFTASLLQDMAVPLLANQIGNDYGLVLDRWHEGSEDLASLERTAFAWDHAEVAAGIAERWSFPDLLRDAIARHHAPDDDPPNELPAVWLVSSLREVNAATGEERLAERVQHDHSISRPDIEDLIEQSRRDGEAMAALFR